MNTHEIDQMIFETTQKIDAEISKLKNLASEKKFSAEEQQQQKRNWQNLAQVPGLKKIKTIFLT